MILLTLRKNTRGPFFYKRGPLIFSVYSFYATGSITVAMVK